MIYCTVENIKHSLVWERILSGIWSPVIKSLPLSNIYWTHTYIMIVIVQKTHKSLPFPLKRLKIDFWKQISDIENKTREIKLDKTYFGEKWTYIANLNGYDVISVQIFGFLWCLFLHPDSNNWCSNVCLSNKTKTELSSLVHRDTIYILAPKCRIICIFHRDILFHTYE